MHTVLQKFGFLTRYLSTICMLSFFLIGYSKQLYLTLDIAPIVI